MSIQLNLNSQNVLVKNGFISIITNYNDKTNSFEFISKRDLCSRIGRGKNIEYVSQPKESIFVFTHKLVTEKETSLCILNESLPDKIENLEGFRKMMNRYSNSDERIEIFGFGHIPSKIEKEIENRGYLPKNIFLKNFTDYNTTLSNPYKKAELNPAASSPASMYNYLNVVKVPITTALFKVDIGQKEVESNLVIADDFSEYHNEYSWQFDGLHGRERKILLNKPFKELPKYIKLGR